MKVSARKEIDRMNLPMSWNEWAQHDGVALAARVRNGELTAQELAIQANAAIAKVNPALSAVVEVFEDAVADPAKAGANLAGPFAGLPFLMKDLGPTMNGRLQEMGSLLMRGNRASADTFLTSKMRQAGLNLIGRTTTPEFGVCSFDYALPAIDYRAAFDAQTTCYISNFAVVIGNMLAARGLERPPADMIEPVNIRIWEAGRHTTFAERARMQAVFNTTSRDFGAFFEQWDIILTPITALPTPKVGTTEYLTISDNLSVLDWFGNLWRNFAFTPLANLCGIPAISLPMAQHEHGLPLGIQAQARQANDGLLLQLAAQIERALGGQWNSGRKPLVHATNG
jgi:Asp-tRNA(Asn)/Glu-tRNA(Gln) amidotransferase A subunit family amidase